MVTADDWDPFSNRGTDTIPAGRPDTDPELSPSRDEAGSAEVEKARESFDRVARANQERLVRYAFEMTGSVEDARDIVQTTLLKAWDVYRAGARPRNARAWLYAIAHNEIANMLRHRRVRREIHRTVILRLEPPEGVPGMDEILPKAFDAVRRLRDPYREAISLHYFHGLSLQETAEVLKVPIGTVKTLVARGLKALRKELGADLDSGRE